MGGHQLTDVTVRADLAAGRSRGSVGGDVSALGSGGSSADESIIEPPSIATVRYTRTCRDLPSETARNADIRGLRQAGGVDPGTAVLGLELQCVDDMLPWRVAERGDAVDVGVRKTGIGDRGARGVQRQFGGRECRSGGRCAKCRHR